MSGGANIWGKLSRVVIFLLLLSALGAVLVWYFPLIKQNEQWAKKKLGLQEQIKLEEELSKHLKGSIKSLQEDPKAVERLARETLGYAKTNEVVIRFSQPITNSQRRVSP
jgi:cell division protein FtsB